MRNYLDEMRWASGQRKTFELCNAQLGRLLMRGKNG